MFKWLWSIWRLVRSIFLLSLPFTFLPFLNGLIEGSFLARYAATKFKAAPEHFKMSVQTAQQMDWFSVPGAPGIHDLGVEPYHIVQIRDPTNWWQKLGLSRFDIDKRNKPPFGVDHLDELADTTTLYRKRRPGEAEGSWHHFLYASAQPLQMAGFFMDGWDEAFYDLLQYHYANPAVSSAEFHYMDCWSNFLCDSWWLDGPSLIHFTTEVSSYQAEKNETQPREQVAGFEPVTVRIIEFPLTDPSLLHLLPGVFPSYFNQLRSVTTSSSIPDTHMENYALVQIERRYESVRRDMYEKHPSTYRRLIDFETFFLDGLLGMEDSFALSLVRLLAVCTSMMAEFVMNWVKVAVVNLYQSYFGQDDDDATPTTPDFEAPGGGALEDNFMGQMLRDFFDVLGDDVEEKMGSTPEGAEALEAMWNVVRRKPEQTGDAFGN